MRRSTPAPEPSRGAPLSWRAEPVAPEAPRRPRRSGFARALGVAVAALLTANGVVVTEEMTGRDLFDLVGGGVSDARSALARALDPDDDREVQAGAVDGTTTTTRPADVAGAVETTSSTTTSTAPAETTTSSAPSRPAPTTPTTARPAAAEKSPLEQVLPDLEAFVARERGLAFQAPVPLVVLAEAAFRSRLNAYRLDPAVEQARRDQPVYRALGIIAPDVDLAAQVPRLSVGGAAAFYDADRNELVVRQGDVTPFLRKILVHELTHALDDQHFELHRPHLRGASDETYEAYEALVEGIAGRVEERYIAALPEGERNAIQAEQQRLAAQIPRDIPAVVIVSFGFPLTAGVRMANALWDAGGAARLNAALQAPPTTTEQVLHPDRYGSGEGPRGVPGPGADGAVVREGSLGQLTLSLMLAQVLDAGYAEAAADGWGGDRYVAWQNGGQSCVRFSVDMDTPEENADMGEALFDWASELPGTTVEGAGPFMVTRCA